MKQESTDWLRQAEANLRAGKNSFHSRDFFLSIFSVQQSVELSLKAYIIEKKGELIKTHDLLKLARIADVPENVFEIIEKLQPSYKEARYPDTSAIIPSERFKETDAKDSISKAEEVVKWIKLKLK